jgi:RNA polymerase sigma factor (TIGR02999 family)
MGDVTQILSAVAAGDPQAASALLPLVYDALRRLAAEKLADEAPGRTFQPTDLVHEAYLRLVGTEGEAHWNSRHHFFAAAAEAMRRLLVEQARRRRTLKRGGGQTRRPLEEVCLLTEEPREDLLAVDEALDRLATADPQKAELVKLRYFAGFTLTEAAELLGISATTADRYWSYARAWLYREIVRNEER